MAQGGIRREVLETVLLVGICGTGVGNFMNSRDSVQEIRDLRNEMAVVLSRLNDQDGAIKVQNIRVQLHETQLGELERRLKLIEERRR